MSCWNTTNVDNVATIELTEFSVQPFAKSNDKDAPISTSSTELKDLMMTRLNHRMDRSDVKQGQYTRAEAQAVK